MSESVSDVESVFLAALEKDSPAERREYLAQACRDNADLRERVERLLRAHDDAGSFLEKPPAELEATQAQPPGSISDTSLDFLTPCEKPDRLGLVGHYEIMEVIGRGGLGIVLKAFDPKLGRIVAVKLPAPEYSANPTARKRFLREAQAAAAVSHNHVVTIHAVDESDSPYLVMEYIDGQSLQEKIDRVGPLGIKEILRVGLQIASGLSAAHAQGLMHRDIKPSNILLENGVERVKITDFGLARAVDDVGITRTGEVTGTPQYMSPEQAQGEPVDHRSDLFSLGSVMYAMCTGRSPFRADSVLAVLKRVCEQEPRPIGEVNAEIPDWLIEIIAKLMAKDPQERFQSAQEVADLLGKHLAHLQQPSVAPQPQRLGFLEKHQSARADSDNDAAEKWWGGIPWPAWIGALLFALVYVIACIDLQGQLPGRTAEGLGVVSYLFATFYAAIWGSAALINRLMRGPRTEPILEPKPWRIVLFFGLLTFFTGMFVVSWANDPVERLSELQDQLLLRQNGYVRIHFADPSINIEVEDADGHVDIDLQRDEEEAFVVVKPGNVVWRAYKDGQIVDAGSLKILRDELIEIKVGDNPDLTAMQRRWWIGSLVRAGVDQPTDGVSGYDFDGDQATVITGGLHIQNQVRLDPSRSPAHIDLTQVEEGKKWRGIYKFDGNELTMCFANGDRPRPSDFTSTSQNKQVLLVLQRSPAEVDDEPASREPTVDESDESPPESTAEPSNQRRQRPEGAKESQFWRALVSRGLTNPKMRWANRHVGAYVKWLSGQGNFDGDSRIQIGNGWAAQFQFRGTRMQLEQLLEYFQAELRYLADQNDARLARRSVKEPMKFELAFITPLSQGQLGVELKNIEQDPDDDAVITGDLEFTIEESARSGVARPDELPEGFDPAPGILSWHEEKAAAEQTAPPPAPLTLKNTPPNQTLDLFASLDPILHAQEQWWEETDDGFQVTDQESFGYHGLLVPRVSIDPNSDYQLTVTLTSVNAVGPSPVITFPVGSTFCSFAYTKWVQMQAGLEKVDGMSSVKSDNPTVVAPAPILPDVKQSFTITVRTRDDEAHITVELEGNPLIDWQGKQSRLSIDSTFHPGKPYSFGIGGTVGFGGAIVYHSAALKLLPESIEQIDGLTARETFRRFERTIQEGKSAAILYDGVMVTTKDGESESRNYWGSYEVKPGGKDASAEFVNGQPKGHGSRSGFGPVNVPVRLDPPPYNFFIGPITRSGFFGRAVSDYLYRDKNQTTRKDAAVETGMTKVAVDALQLITGGFSEFYLIPVNRLQFDEESNDDQIVLSYQLNPLEDRPWQARLWIDRHTNAPIRRVVKFTVDGREFVFTETYRGLSTEEILEPFDKNIRSSKLADYRLLKGRVTEQRDEKWIPTDWILNEKTYRAEEPIEFVLSDPGRTRIQIAAGSEFLLDDRILTLTKGTISAELPYNSRLRLGLESAVVYPTPLTSGRSILVATPDRVVAEQGALRAYDGSNDDKGGVLLKEGIEYTFQDGHLTEQAQRTLPPSSIRSHERIVYELDLTDEEAVNQLLHRSRWIEHSGRKVLASVANPQKPKEMILSLKAPDDGALFKHAPNLHLRYRYHLIGKQKDLDFYMHNHDKDSDYRDSLVFVQVGHWTTCTIPVATNSTYHGPAAHPQVGDQYDALRWQARGDDAELLIDQIQLVQILDEEPKQPDQPIDEKNDTTATLDRLVELAERKLERLQKLSEANRSVIAQKELTKAEAELIEAKIRRAEALKDQTELVTLLERLEELKKKDLDRLQSLRDSKTVSESAFRRAQIELIEVQIRLAKARGNRKKELELLKEVVKQYEEEFTQIKRLAERGFVAESQVDLAEQIYLEAKLRLESAQ